MIEGKRCRPPRAGHRIQYEKPQWEQARHNDNDANSNQTMHNDKVDRKPQIPLDTNADTLLKGKNPTNDGSISQRQVTKPINLVGRSPPYKTAKETLGINGSKITKPPKIP